MSNIIDIRKYLPNKFDHFLFDTNIWVYIFFYTANVGQKRIRPYSAFYKKILTSGSAVYISSLILLEFIGVCIRKEMNYFAKKHNLNRISFKENFRGTPEHRKAIIGIEKIVNNILKKTKKIDDKFGSINFYDLYRNLDKIDLNDNYQIALASKEKLKIITHDADFGINKTVPILTASKKLLYP